MVGQTRRVASLPSLRPTHGEGPMNAKPLTIDAHEVQHFGTSEPRLLGECHDCSGRGRWAEPPSYTARHEATGTCDTCNGSGEGPRWAMALIGGFHRDSDALDQSNALVLEAWLDDATDGVGDGWDRMRASHWAVGWYSHLIVDPTDERVMAVLQRAQAKLDTYCALSEDHWSELEYTQHHDGECHSSCPHEHCERCGKARDEYHDLCGDCRANDTECEDSDDE
jgi:hypothetical protein